MRNFICQLLLFFSTGVVFGQAIFFEGNKSYEVRNVSVGQEDGLAFFFQRTIEEDTNSTNGQIDWNTTKHILYIFKDTSFLGEFDIPINKLSISGFGINCFYKDSIFHFIGNETKKVNSDTTLFIVNKSWHLGKKQLIDSTQISGGDVIYDMGSYMLDSLLFMRVATFSGQGDSLLVYNLNSKKVDTTYYIDYLFDSRKSQFLLDDSNKRIIHFSTPFLHEYNLITKEFIELKDDFAVISQNRPTSLEIKDKSLTYLNWVTDLSNLSSITTNLFLERYDMDTEEIDKIQLNDSLIQSHTNDVFRQKDEKENAQYFVFDRRDNPLNLDTDVVFTSYKNKKTTIVFQTRNELGVLETEKTIFRKGYSYPTGFLKNNFGFTVYGVYWGFESDINLFKKTPFVLFIDEQGELLGKREFTSQKERITLYPNPTNSALNFEQPLSNYSIFNLQGNLISNGYVPTTTIDVANFERGIYLIKGQTSERKQFLQKFVKQ